MKYITSKKLKELGACTKQLKLFNALFGTKARVNFDNMMTARTCGLVYTWLIDKLLSTEQREKLEHVNDNLRRERNERMQKRLKQFVNDECGHEEAHFLYYDMNDEQTTYVNKYMCEVVKLLLEVPD